MKHKRKTAKRDTSLSYGVLIGAGVSLLVVLAATALLTTLIMGQKVDLTAMQYFAPMVLLLSFFAGAFTAACIVREGKLLAGICAPGSIFFVLTATAILFFEISLRGFLFGFLALVLGCGAAIILCMSTKRKRKYSRKF